MSESQGNELSFELLKNTQQIAEQAAMRAKEMAMRSKVPDIPMRGGNGEQQKAPEIPPKRLNLKKLIDENGTNGDDGGKPIPVPQRNQAQKIPPPIPQKPASATNSPRLQDKLPHQPQNIQLQPQNMFHERVSQSPQLSSKNQNIVNILNSPLFQQRANQYKLQQQQVQQQQSQMIRQQQMKPDEDFGSEDALRGIERGLKNMERAMKEQMTMRNMDKGGEIQFNPMEFKRSLGGGSINSLDGSNAPNMRMMGGMNMRLNFDGQQWSQRGIERNISMDQMRLEALQGTGPMKNIPMDFSQQPKHNIYRSLDRTLPLELQFSRHRQQQEQFEFMRQNNQNMNQRQPTGLSREDVNLRRRSSHDETQFIMQQQQPQSKPGSTASVDNAGGMHNDHSTRIFISAYFCVRTARCAF